MENKIKNECTSHLHGDVTKINIYEMNNGSSRVIMNVRTIRFYEKDGVKNYPATNHTVTVNTSDENFLKEARGIEERLEARKKGFENKSQKIEDCPKVSLDAVPVLRNNPAFIQLKDNQPILTEEGKLKFVQEGKDAGKLLDSKGEQIVFRNSEYVAKPETVKFDQELQKDEVRNKTILKGNIRSIQKHEDHDFMTLFIDTHYLAPNPNAKEGEKPYKEMTSEHIVKLNKDRSKGMEKAYNDIMNGDIAVGDLITVQGPKYQTDYPVKGYFNGKEYTFSRFELYTSASSLQLEMRSKKNLQAGEKEAPESKKEQKADAKKATSKKTTKATEKKAAGVKM